MRENSRFNMFWFILVIICLLAWAKVSFGGTKYAMWEETLEPDVVGWNIYVNSIETGDNLLKLNSNINYCIFEFDGECCVFVTAIDTAGNESPPSETVCHSYPRGDFNFDNMVDVYDNILFNLAWDAFVKFGTCDFRFDLYPVGAPDGVIDVYDKLQFHKYWRPQQ